MLKKLVPLFLFALIIALSNLSAQAQGGFRNGLPPTQMDSFVRNAAGNADQIYGDEGFTDIPPFFGYTYDHRINNGITGVRDRGLTTGHGSYLPSASGSDEFLGAEWSRSGANYGNSENNGAGNPGFDFTAQENQITQLERRLTTSQNLLTQAQSDLRSALRALSQPNLTAAQRMAAQIAADDARRQISALKSSIERTNSTLSGLDKRLARNQSHAEQY